MRFETWKEEEAAAAVVAATDFITQSGRQKKRLFERQTSWRRGFGCLLPSLNVNFDMRSIIPQKSRHTHKSSFWWRKLGQDAAIIFFQPYLMRDRPTARLR